MAFRAGALALKGSLLFSPIFPFPSSCSDSQELLSDDDWGESKPMLSEQKSYLVMAKEDVINQSKEMIDGVRELLSLSSSAAAAALLRHFKWNRERLLETYMSNPEKTLFEIGKHRTSKQERELIFFAFLPLSNLGTLPSSTLTTEQTNKARESLFSSSLLPLSGMGSLALEVPPPPRPELFECLCCLEEVLMNSTFSLGCGHRYCAACWSDFLTVQVDRGELIFEEL